MKILTSSSIPAYYLDEKNTPQQNVKPWSLGSFLIRDNGRERDFSIGMFIRPGTDPTGAATVEYCGSEGPKTNDEHEFLALQFKLPVEVGKNEGTFIYLLHVNPGGDLPYLVPYFGEDVKLNIDEISPSPYPDIPNIAGTLNGDFSGPAGNKIIEATFRFAFIGIN